MNGVAFILAKNEEANIERSIAALKAAGVTVTVLDSGSTDRTTEIAEAMGAAIEPYRYVNHLTAYRYLCAERIPRGELGLVLDADMVVTRELANELGTLGPRPEVEVVTAPIEMWWNGVKLEHGSLCPPKPVAFRGGGDYFVASGHGEKLRAGVQEIATQAPLIHDDRKSFAAYLSSQARYAENLVARSRSGHLRLIDRLRLASPIPMVGVPLFSLLMKGGITAGKTGVVYALDRLIAEAIMFRQGLAARMPKPTAPGPSKASKRS